MLEGTRNNRIILWVFFIIVEALNRIILSALVDTYELGYAL